MWAPSVSSGVVYGVAHESNPPASTRHSKTEPVSVAVSSKVGVESFVSPVGPAAIAVSGASVSTENARLAGVSSTLPAASVARTSKVCAPSVSAAVVRGEPHVANAAASTRHSKLAPASLENAKVGVESLVSPLGPASTVVSGGVVSTVQACVAGDSSMLNQTSTARTANVCGPSASPISALGERQAAKAAPSSEHSNVAGSLAPNVNVAPVSRVAAGGPPASVVSGGSSSRTTRHV